MLRGAAPAIVEKLQRLDRKRARRFDARGGLGQSQLHRLELSDRPSECDAFAGIDLGALDGGARQPAGLEPEKRARGLDATIEPFDTGRSGAEHVFGRHLRRIRR